VAIYGLSASPIARWLKLAKPNPQGCLIIGAHQWARDIAKALYEHNYQVLLADSHHENVTSALKMGLPTFHANILSKSILDKMQLDGIGHLLAMTSNDEVNSLAALHFGDIFGRSKVYQLPPASDLKDIKRDVFPQHLRGRILFGHKNTYTYLTSLYENGAKIKKTCLTEELDYKAFQSIYGETSIPLFLAKDTGDELIIYASDNEPSPKPGQVLISLVNVKNKT
jgi:hypothetical protein